MIIFYIHDLFLLCNLIMTIFDLASPPTTPYLSLISHPTCKDFWLLNLNITAIFQLYMAYPEIIAKVNLFWNLKMAYKIFKFFFESSLDNKPKELKIIRKSGVNICSHRNQKQLIGFSSKGFMTIFSMRTKSSLLFTPTEDYWWDPVAVSLFWSPTCASRNIMRIKNTSYLLHSLIDNTCLIYFWILNFVK